MGRCVDWTCDYVACYDDVVQNARSGVALVERIGSRHRHVKGNAFAAEWSARLLFPRSCPDWFEPLPGAPGQVLLNPQGHYDGYPPREPWED